MPNWCYNTLKVSGKTTDLKEFERKAKGKKTDLSFANFMPEPDYTKVKVKPTFPETDKKFGKVRKYVNPKSAWWDWRIQNWGTKWEVEAEIYQRSPKHLRYCFDSAWSPPSEKWLEIVSKMFPKLSFRLNYEEGGMGFKGYTTAKNGIVKDTCYKM